MPPRALAAIPHFALYGETAFTHKPEFVHIEFIHERSERNGWLIKPHRHPHLFQVLFMFKGSAEVWLDTNSSEHKGCWLVTMPPGVVHGFNFQPHTQGIVLSLVISMLGVDAGSQLASLLEGTLAHPHILPVARHSAQYRELYDYFLKIRQEQDARHEDQQPALLSLVKLVLISLRRCLRQQQDTQPQTASVLLINRFRQLLEQHYRQHWKIDAYAELLHVSVSTLNRACQHVLGNSIKKVIQQRLHIEAKRRLIYTTETLDQISWDLGFTDAPYFSRVFKQLEGTAPKAFRRQADRGQQVVTGNIGKLH